MANGTDDDSSEDDWMPLSLQIVNASILTISLYNAVELFVLIFVAFSAFKGLYFWSLLLSTLVGIVPYAIGSLLGFFLPLPSSSWICFVLVSVGWWTMTTGQSLTLYSRLHLVLRNPKVLRLVLFMIIANALILHLPSAIISFGYYSRDSLFEAYFTVEKVQMTVFSIQELIISTLYIWETIKLLRFSPENGNRRIMCQLISINVIVTLMDIGLLAAVYADLFYFEPSLRVTIYSVKLKLEFAVLRQLVNLANSHSCSLDFTIGSNGFPDFVDPSRITTDITHAPRPTSTASTIAILDPHDEHPSGHGGHSETRRSWSGGTQTNQINTDTTSTLRGSSRPVSREKKAHSDNPESECPG
ncbi:hypothetical protein EMCG_00512 [[Emmonsia] crescens]|uniref:DUF7703 domain-containing protein n=1 Tax=[Emmonsia] crescens TaxID=73230 RepID=A0A0G2HVJ6_9EURO|nr:hypothetical protein EMCG_00512 [Emmonsia crescens UAMH 3008]